MKIELTNIIDSNIVKNDITAFKVLLADDLISFFTPLFYEDIRKKQSQLKRNVADIKKLKQDYLDEQKKSKQLKFLISKDEIKKKILRN